MSDQRDAQTQPASQDARTSAGAGSAARDPNVPLVSIDIGARPAVRITRATKGARLPTLLASHPVEFYDRVRAIVETRARRRSPTAARYATCSWNQLAEKLHQHLPPNASFQRDDPALTLIRRRLTDRLRMIGEVPFHNLFDADPVLARLAYNLTVALRPAVVVETGVALGITSSFVLAAMQQIGFGKLISIDLPPLGVEPDAIGRIIPDDLRDRWTLLRGASSRELKRVLPDQPPVGLFIHDSLFTRRNAMAEYQLILPHLAPRAAIVANRVDLSDAFEWLVRESHPSVSAVLSAEAKKNELIGMCLYTPAG